MKDFAAPDPGLAPSGPTCPLGTFVRRTLEMAAAKANLPEKYRPYHEAGHYLANHALALDVCTRVSVPRDGALTAYANGVPAAGSLDRAEAPRHAFRSLAGPAAEFMLFGCQQANVVVRPQYQDYKSAQDFDRAIAYLDRHKGYAPRSAAERYAERRPLLEQIVHRMRHDFFERNRPQLQHCAEFFLARGEVAGPELEALTAGLPVLNRSFFDQPLRELAEW